MSSSLMQQHDSSTILGSSKMCSGPHMSQSEGNTALFGSGAVVSVLRLVPPRMAKAKDADLCHVGQAGSQQGRI